MCLKVHPSSILKCHHRVRGLSSLPSWDIPAMSCQATSLGNVSFEQALRSLQAPLLLLGGQAADDTSLAVHS